MTVLRLVVGVGTLWLWLPLGAWSGLVFAQKPAPADSGCRVPLADLDAGFWRHYRDNRYAADEAPEKPAICEIDAQGNRRVVIKRPHDAVQAAIVGALGQREEDVQSYGAGDAAQRIVGRLVEGLAA